MTSTWKAVELELINSNSKACSCHESLANFITGGDKH